MPKLHEDSSRLTAYSQDEDKIGVVEGAANGRRLAARSQRLTAVGESLKRRRR